MACFSHEPGYNEPRAEQEQGSQNGKGGKAKGGWVERPEGRAEEGNRLRVVLRASSKVGGQMRRALKGLCHVRD
jgi:hypothetical protein